MTRLILSICAVWLWGTGLAFSQGNYTQMSLPDNAIARLGKGRIHGVAYSPNGRLFAVASSVGTWLYDPDTWEELALLPGHTRVVTFSPNGRILAATGESETVKLWDIKQGREIAILEGHLFSVLAIAISPDGQTLATGSFDKTIKLWDVAQR